MSRALPLPAEAIAASYIAGETIATLAAWHGCGCETIRLLLHRLEIKTRPRGFPKGYCFDRTLPLNVAELAEKRAAGVLLKTLAHQHGCSLWTIRRRLEARS
jgi:hypothetical protein